MKKLMTLLLALCSVLVCSTGIACFGGDSSSSNASSVEESLGSSVENNSSEEEHTHSFVENKDETHHWTECECGEATEKIAHSHTEQKDSDYHWTECSCGDATEKIAHSYAEQKDSDYHWTECSCGDATEKIAHSYTSKRDSENHWEECSCSMKINVVPHAYVEKYDDTQHWTECTCGETTVKVAHAMVGCTCSECAYRSYVRVNKDNAENAQGEYILFGSYPQTKVTDSALIDTLNTQASMLPTSEDSQAWTSYDYYISNSNATDYMWYQDEVYNGETYRGVYFTSYRPYWTDYSSSTGNTYQDDNGYTTSTSYWFKYEPIKWRILDESNGTALILCEMLIDSQDYNYTRQTVNGVYANNYAESSIREWLNNNFYNTAFNSLQKQLIELTTVDNSAATTDSTSNEYACANTEDNVFLLSYQDVLNTSYGFSSSYSTDTARQKKTTDYAQCQGAYIYSGGSYDGNGCWWLRSPSSRNSYTAPIVYGDGDSGSYRNVYITGGGVCPALRMRLSYN